MTWNPNGSLGALAITDQLNTADSQTCNYSHDDLSRIASANCGTPWSQTFSFDPFGNVSKTGTGTFLPTYSASTNRFLTIPGGTPTYDANGNLTYDLSHSYTWDAEGKALSIDTVNLTYDALGRMVEQNRSGSYTEIVYGPTGGKLALMSGQSLQKAFVPLPAGATAVYNSAGLAYYRHADWQGSSRLASTPSRTKYYDVAYGPYGESYVGSGTTDLDFTGQNQDTVSGLYDFLFREYHPAQGRWISPDPAGLAAVDPASPQTWNRYAYVGNNPLAFVDPLGLFWIQACVDIGDGSPSCTWDWVDDGPGGGGFSGDPIAGGGGGGGGGGDGSAANNGQQQTPTATHCLGQALKAKGLSIALDIAGTVPVFGNLFSGTAEGIQALDAAYYGGLAVMNAGNTVMNPSASGAVSTATTFGLTAASLALNGSKMIPVAGNVVSGLTGLYDSYQAYKTYQQCMAGGG